VGLKHALFPHVAAGLLALALMPRLCPGLLHGLLLLLRLRGEQLSPSARVPMA
jgi:hypothetical protein